MNLPNRLTLFRIALVPLLILIWIFPYGQLNIELPFFQFEYVMLSLKNLMVLLIFVVASFTDFLDGYLARKNNLVTTFGKFADPIADKLLVNIMLLLLVESGYIPVVPVALMLARDTIVDGVRMVASSNGVVVSAGYLGKVKTVSQMVAIVFILLNNLPFELYHIPFSNFMLWFATLVSIVSGISYFIQLKEFIFESM